jgi:hypothetical protein
MLAPIIFPVAATEALTPGIDLVSLWVPLTLLGLIVLAAVYFSRL